jgi:NitT/TauT family transport system permease protein
MKGVIPPISVRQPFFWFWDIVAIILILGVLIFLAEASRGLSLPLDTLHTTPVTLDPWNLPVYAARTSLRMLTALLLSLVFTLTYATLAARNRHAELVLIPLLDILQSVPILGFISVTIVFFMSLAPGKVLGAEFAAVFAIFTSQAWNMAFSFYQSLRTVPDDLIEASRCFRFGAWMRFWRLDVPFAMPALIWNMMMSMSGGWFFVVASEAISVGDTTITLPGIGSYIALAISQRDFVSIMWAIVAMFVVIMIFDQLMFRPLVAWGDRFRFEQETGVQPSKSWLLKTLRQARLFRALAAPFAAAMRWSFRALPKGQKVGSLYCGSARPCHHDARVCADCFGQRGLDSDRHMDWIESATCVAYANPWRNSSRRFRRTYFSPSSYRVSSFFVSTRTSGSVL